jgi:GDP-D-mannose dehydratase
VWIDPVVNQFLVDKEIDVAVEEVDREFDKVDREFDEVDREFDKVDREFNEVDREFDKVDEAVVVMVDMEYASAKLGFDIEGKKKYYKMQK